LGSNYASPIIHLSYGFFRVISICVIEESLKRDYYNNLDKRRWSLGQVTVLAMNKVKGGKIWNLFNIELTEQAKRLNDT
jgi:hypothetical protein